MINDNDDDGNGMILSRRDAIRGGAALGTLALASRIGAYAQVVEAQITEPRIQLGSDYAIHDNGGNLVINHDPNGDILEYDATADEITTLKPLGSNLDLSDNDITNVGALTTESATINQVVGKASLASNQTVSTATVTQINLGTSNIEDSDVVTVDLANNKITVDVAGTYMLHAMVQFTGSANWSVGDRIQTRIKVGASVFTEEYNQHGGANNNQTVVASAVGFISSGTDVIAELYHESGSDESIQSGEPATFLQVVRIG